MVYNTLLRTNFQLPVPNSECVVQCSNGAHQKGNLEERIPAQKMCEVRAPVWFYYVRSPSSTSSSIITHIGQQGRYPAAWVSRMRVAQGVDLGHLGRTVFAPMAEGFLVKQLAVGRCQCLRLRPAIEKRPMFQKFLHFCLEKIKKKVVFRFQELFRCYSWQVRGKPTYLGTVYACRVCADCRPSYTSFTLAKSHAISVSTAKREEVATRTGASARRLFWPFQ